MTNNGDTPDFLPSYSAPTRVRQHVIDTIAELQAAGTLPAPQVIDGGTPDSAQTPPPSP